MAPDTYSQSVTSCNRSNSRSRSARMKDSQPAVRRIRELVVRYKPLQVPLPVSATVRTPLDATTLASAVLADSDVERVIALHLNTKHRLIGVHMVSVGTLDASLVHPREVFKAAYLSNASGLIVAHNHPSGDPTPSRDDRVLAGQLHQASELLGVDLLDFLIVTDPIDATDHFSFREAGELS